MVRGAGAGAGAGEGAGAGHTKRNPRAGDKFNTIYCNQKVQERLCLHVRLAQKKILVFYDSFPT